LGMKLSIVLILFTAVFTTNFFQDNFKGDWQKRWVTSTREGLGKFDVKDGGLKTTEDAKFYGISSKMSTTIQTKGNNLVIQLAVRHPQGIDCGGGYLKLVKDSLKQEEFKGDSEYGIMFGPDICGSTRKVHLIFNYNGKNLDCKKNIDAPSDKLTHSFTAIIKSDDTYEVLLDGEKKESGKLSEDWEFMEPKNIPDADAKKTRRLGK